MKSPKALKSLAFAIIMERKILNSNDIFIDDDSFGSHMYSGILVTFFIVNNRLKKRRKKAVKIYCKDYTLEYY